MRIISGIHKGHRFNPPKGFPSRPTTDQAKEALFNIIGNWYYFEELKVLDLFSGTGNISMEFSSRGTEHIVAVEKDFKVIKFAKTLCDKLGIENISQIKGDVYEFLEKHSDSYDVIFADPPFHKEETLLIPALVFKNNLLKEKGTLIIEHGKTTSFEDDPYFSEVRNYGGVYFSIFEKE